MQNISLRFKLLLLLLGDLAIFQAALALMLRLRYQDLRLSDWNLHIIPFGIVSVLWVIGMYVAGLYDLNTTKNGIKFFRLYLETMIANLAVAVAFFYLLPFFNIAPRTNLFLYFAIVLLIGYSWRLFFNRLIAPTLFRNRVLFVGNPTDAAKIRDLIQRSAFGFELVGVVETMEGTRLEDENICWYKSFETLESIIPERKIDTVLLGHRPDDVPGLREALYKTLFHPVALLDRATLEENMTGRVPLDYVSQTWFLEHLRENEKTWYESFKRLTDIVIAIPFGILTLALWPFIAFAIKISSPGPVLYSQIRVGKIGKTFRIWKFRTMRQDAEAMGKPQFASQDDPRITKVGKFLRATRIDELPQIWNVFRGEMSLIGPRPERPEFVAELTLQMPYYTLRHLTRPGLTGWAQVKFPYAGNLEDNLKKLQYDLHYIKHRSFLTDVAILLKTIGIVIRRQGT